MVLQHLDRIQNAHNYIWCFKSMRARLILMHTYTYTNKTRLYTAIVFRMISMLGFSYATQYTISPVWIRQRRRRGTTLHVIIAYTTFFSFKQYLFLFYLKACLCQLYILSFMWLQKNSNKEKNNFKADLTFCDYFDDKNYFFKELVILFILCAHSDENQKFM